MLLTHFFDTALTLESLAVNPAFYPISMSSSVLIRLQEVRFAYDSRPILDGICLTVPRGQVTAIMGASGGG